jgi:hypothetical protein
MKDAAVQNSAAHSAAVNSPLNDSGRVDALLSQRQPNTERWGAAALEQRRANAGSSGKNCCSSRDLDRTEQYYYGLLNRLRFLWDRRNKFYQFAAYVRQSGRSDWIPVYGRATTSRTFFLAHGRQ